MEVINIDFFVNNDDFLLFWDYCMIYLDSFVILFIM